MQVQPTVILRHLLFIITKATQLYNETLPTEKMTKYSETDLDEIEDPISEFRFHGRMIRSPP